MATWPDSLPRFSTDGYQEAPKSQILESEMDVGPPKARPRSTASYRGISVRVVVDATQLDTFENFYRDESAGAIPFDIMQPRTGQMVRCRITGDPPYTITPFNNSSQYWVLAFQLQTAL